MVALEVSNGVLKRLALEYQETKDPEVMEQFLQRVDKLALRWTHLLKFKHWYLRREDLESIYQTCIVGVYRGVRKITFATPLRLIPAVLVAYMRAEVELMFRRRPIRDLIEYGQQQEVPEDSVYAGLEFECLQTLIQKFIDEDIITEDEYRMIWAHYVDDISVTVLAHHYELHPDTIRSKMSGALSKLRHQLRQHGVTGEE